MEKNKHAQQMAKMKWKKMTEEDQNRHIKKMVDARKSKKEKEDLTRLAQDAIIE